MIFFTSMIIVAILYYLQAEGMIYVTIVALSAELVNIFLTHTMTKSVEKKLNLRHQLAVKGYLTSIKAYKNTIKELERIQDDAGSKLYKANEKIKELEAKLETEKKEQPPVDSPETETQVTQSQPPQIKKPEPPAPDAYNDLPDGSRR